MDKIALVAKREYLVYITAWGFWLGMILTPLILFLAMGLPALIEKTQPARYYAVIDPEGVFAEELATELANQREDVAIDLLKSQSLLSGPELAEANLQKFNRLREAGEDVVTALNEVMPGAAVGLPSTGYMKIELDAEKPADLFPALVGDKLVEGPAGARPLYAALFVFPDRIEYWSDDVVVPDLQRLAERVSAKLALRFALADSGVDESIVEQSRADALPVTPLSPSALAETGEVSLVDQAPFFIAIGFSFLLWLLIFSVVNYLLTGTIEERSNKIFDALLTSISLPQLLAGKLLGVLLLSCTLVSVWAGSTLILGAMAQNALPPEAMQILSMVAEPKLIFPALLSFMLGYVMFGSIFLALGSLCDSIQEAQSLLSPIFIVMMVPLVMIPVAINNPDSPLLSAVSWVPLMTPFLLIIRIPSEPPLLELVLQIVWMAGFAGIILWAGTRIYRAGAVNGVGLEEVRAGFLKLFSNKNLVKK